MNSKLSQWCEGLIEAGVLAVLIAAPLFFNIHSDRVFEPDKLTIVRSVAVLMAAAWLVRFIDTRGWERLGSLRSPDGEPERSIWRTPFVLPIFLLVVVYLLATFFSVVPRVSWAGSYQRLQGTYTTLSYIVIFALTAATIRRRDQLNRLVTTVIITSVPVSLYALLQHYGLDPLPWGGDTQRRVAGHMGNAIFIAAYIIMAVPLTVARIVDAFTNILADEEVAYADVVRSSVYIFTLAIQLIAIYWTQSRGPLLGLMVGMFAFVLILLVSLRNAEAGRRRFGLPDLLQAVALAGGSMIVGFGILYALFSAAVRTEQAEALGGEMASFAAFVGAVGVTVLVILVMMAMRRGWRWLWLSWILLTLFLAGWLVAFNLPDDVAAPHLDTPLVGDALNALSEWRELPTVGRFGQLLQAESGSGRVRVLIWEGALELVQPHEPLAFPNGEEDRFNFLRPLVGYGPESMYVAYNRFYLPELATVEARNASPDRAHNETFDALVITGAMGFLVWQLLYLSVFFYGFRWLGMLRSRRDGYLLIGMWIGGAIVGAVLLTQLLGAVYIGVAIPFGSIGGLVLYLIYYALFAGTRETTEDEVHDPFDVGRLLMLGLLTAVVAHYVEIHFGIAIASTRVHFFVYLAMILLIGHLLPEKEEEDLALDAAPTFRGGRARGRRRMGPDRPGWLSPALAVAFILTVMLGILGYEFMNYARPADLQISSISDVPSAGDILHQAFFLHPGQDFRDSPFIFLLIILTWILGTLAFVSEMVKLGLLKVQPGRERRQDAGNRQTAGIIFVGLLLAGVGARLLGDEATAGTTVLLGSALLLIWGALCLFAAVRLFLKHEPAQETAGIVAALGFATSIPVMVAGAGFYGLLMFAGCGFILYLLWKESWNGWILPGLTIAALSLTIGLSFAYLQAAQIRQAVFFGPQVQNTVSDVERVLLTTDMFASFLTIFYMFLIGLMLLAAFVLAGGGARRVRELGSTAGFVSAAILFILALGIVNTTNMQIIQADIVYKQARPLDQQATRAGNPTLWDVPIAIYEHAIELAPQEDFYYLFLGRAYLEKSAGVQDPAIQQDLLETARDRLLLAQEINPLNTDHTANLARLTTRWASLESVTEPERKSLLAEAERYYQDALALSPQNSVIRNEYANLLATLDGDCEASIDVYEQSLEIDPFFPDTYFNLANIYNICAAQLVDADVAGAADGVEAADYYRRAAELLEEGLARERRPTNTETVLVQAGELYQQAGEYEAAIAALQEAQANGNNQVPRWNIDFRLASIYLAMGDQERALDLARDALAAAPADAHPQIQTFIEQIGEQ